MQPHNPAPRKKCQTARAARMWPTRPAVPLCKAPARPPSRHGSLHNPGRHHQGVHPSSPFNMPDVCESTRAISCRACSPQQNQLDTPCKPTLNGQCSKVAAVSHTHTRSVPPPCRLTSSAEPHVLCCCHAQHVTTATSLPDKLTSTGTDRNQAATTPSKGSTRKKESAGSLTQGTPHI